MGFSARSSLTLPIARPLIKAGDDVSRPNSDVAVTKQPMQYSAEPGLSGKTVGDLSAFQIDRFIGDGFVKIEHAFARELADEARSILWKGTGCDPDDASTWTRPVVRLGMYSQELLVRAANTPVLHRALGPTCRPGPVACLPQHGYLCLPFIVHSAQPHRGMHPRFMAQPPLLPRQPVSLRRDDDDYSPVELAIRHALQEF